MRWYPGFETAKAYALWEGRSLPEQEREIFEESLDDLLQPLFVQIPRQVEVRTLPELFDEHNIERIDFLKIDVEGSELDVIEGMRDADWPRIENIVVEVDERQVSVRQIVTFIESRKMKCEVYQPDPYLRTGLHLVCAHTAP